MDFLKALELPWLQAAQQRLSAAHAAGRLPPSLLLLSNPGTGSEQLAYWLAAVCLCDRAEARPCGNCASCRLLRADSHPDLHLIGPQAPAQQIKVDQVRALIDVLALKSYRGGFKVAVIENAEALNVNGANAFLKTLEEPTADTLLVLLAKPSHRLPATIASRCMRLTLRAPPRAQALQWLQAQSATAAGKSWDAALEISGGAPLAALELDADFLAELAADMRATLQRLAADSVDATLVAEQWVRSHPAVRICWLENCITQRLLAALGRTVVHHTAEAGRLPGALLKPKIRALFELLDAARELRRFAATGINMQSALEALLIGGRAALEQ